MWHKVVYVIVISIWFNKYYKNGFLKIFILFFVSDITKNTWKIIYNNLPESPDLYYL